MPLVPVKKRQPAGVSEEQLRVVRSIVDPKLFFQTYLDVELWNTQAEILDAVAIHPRVAVKACHASSKTFSASRLVLWFLARYHEAVVITTAPTWNQVEQLMWGEIHSALIKNKFPFVDKNQKRIQANLTEFKLGPKRLAYGLSTAVTKQDEGVRIQGIHAENVLVIIDEAPGINPKILEAVEGARAGGNVRVLMLGNPTIASGPFHSAFVDERFGWKTFTIDGFTTPNFQTIPGFIEKVEDGQVVGMTDEAGNVIEGSKLWFLLNLPDEELDNNVCPYLITRRWVKEKFYEWGPGHPSWQSRVRGQFPSQSSDALISLAWLEAQKIREDLPEKATDEVVAGLDVAGPGEDETSLTIRRGPKIIFHRQWPNEDPRGEVVTALNPYKQILKSVNVDRVGIGEGMYQHLLDLKFPVNPVNVQERANDPELFADLKSEYFWGLRVRLQQGDFCGLGDEKTIGQLAGIRYKQNSRGQTEIESKDDARKRGVKSPDRAESVMMAFATQTKVYGVLSYYNEIKTKMQKVESSKLIKPVTNDKTLSCPQCSAVCCVPCNNGFICNSCGHQWGNKQNIPTFTRRDYLAKLDFSKKNRW